MTNDNSLSAASIARFEKARRQALRDEVSAKLTGRDTRMLPFDEIRHKLRQQHPLYQGIQEIPVENVVGSVGRYKEFNRHFLPLNDSIKARWIGVDKLAQSKGWPPIEVYHVGDVYFVKDGNHRLSVAKQMGLPTIEAHVWHYPESVSIEPDDNVDDVLIRLGKERFLERTHLDEKFPNNHITFTSPGRYSELLAQIENLRQKLSEIDGADMAYDDAVSSWYEMIYLPTSQIIHDADMLNEFPGRTEADLFVWLSKHREGLREEYGNYDNLWELAEKLGDIYKENSVQKLARQVRRMLGEDALPPLAETAVAGTNEEE